MCGLVCCYYSDCCVNPSSSLGFPAHSCTAAELRGHLRSACATQPGWLSYPEFTAVLLGRAQAQPQTAAATTAAGAGAGAGIRAAYELNHDVLQSFLVVNNLNLRLLFRARDTDCDGMLTVEEVMRWALARML